MEVPYPLCFFNGSYLFHFVSELFAHLSLQKLTVSNLLFPASLAARALAHDMHRDTNKSSPQILSQELVT